MTIKHRFITTYISAIAVTLVSVFLIFSVVSYSTLGKIPSIKNIYSMLTTNQPLSEQEKQSFLTLQTLVKSSPNLLEPTLKDEAKDIIQSIEKQNINIVIRKGNNVLYHSEELKASSLRVHMPEFDESNLNPTGTMDNNGRFYNYIKYSFRYEDGTFGDFLILKRQTNLFEFFIRWGIWMILFILILSALIFWFISKRLSKTVIKPLVTLEKNARYLVEQNNILTENPFTDDSKGAKEVEQLKESLYQMWTDLQSARLVQKKYEENRKELIANISHDLKTPITSILGYVEGLQENIAQTPEKRALYLATIHEKSLVLNELIDELFLYSKLDMDSVNLSFSKIDFTFYIQKFESEIARHENVNVILQLPQDELPVLLDTAYFDRVMQNLIQNSFKFAQAEQQLEIILTLFKTSKGIQFIFEDNGRGISPEDLPYIFDRLYRSDKSRTSQIKGSGLGLSIVKQIVEQHQGSVHAESTLNKGTRIIIILPKA
ncbi:HAMP domain-containing histidine kinase [Lactococcus garvieae]|nr:HAMP domain-containing histidine kinase [Lactococcus garvieae]